MSKPLFVISSPFDTFSGYGARARDLIKAIIELDKYDVKLISQRWGETPWGFTDENQEWAFLKQYALPTPQLPKQPEIWMQITVPNEFQPIGKYNIGVTAGIETTVCSHEFLEGVNRMDLTLVSSNHAKKVFTDTKFERVNQQTGAKEGTISLTKPVEVVFEGANTEIYKVLDIIEQNVLSIVQNISDGTPVNIIQNRITYLRKLISELPEGYEDYGDFGCMIHNIIDSITNGIDYTLVIANIEQIHTTLSADVKILDDFDELKNILFSIITNIKDGTPINIIQNRIKYLMNQITKIECK